MHCKKKLSKTEKIWAQVYQHGNLAPYMTDPAPCWIWQGPTDLDNRPRLSEAIKSPYARNAVYELATGPISKHGKLRAQCRVRKCVNPSHMRVVPRKIAQKQLKPRDGHPTWPDWYDPSGWPPGRIRASSILRTDPTGILGKPMITPPDCDAVIVTRGNVDLTPILESLRFFRRVIVWDNSQKGTNLKVWGRYHAALTAETQVVYIQDDDCIIHEHQDILDAWSPGHIVANMPVGRRPEYADGIALLGYGSCFERNLIQPTFQRYFQRWLSDDLFVSECDRVFTALNPLTLVDTPYTNFAYAEANDRMWKESHHLADLRAIRHRIARVKATDEIA